MTLNIEKIVWRDAFDLNASEWGATSDISPDSVECLITSVGFLVMETEHFVLITHSHSPEGQTRGTFCIPKVCIQERTTVVGRLVA